MRFFKFKPNTIILSEDQRDDGRTSIIFTLPAFLSIIYYLTISIQGISGDLFNVIFPLYV